MANSSDTSVENEQYEVLEAAYVVGFYERPHYSAGADS